MMNQHGIRPLFHSHIQQCLARSDSTDQGFYLGPPLHLQAVWAIIVEVIDRQQAMDIGNQLAQLHDSTARQDFPECADQRCILFGRADGDPQKLINARQAKVTDDDAPFPQNVH